VALASSLLCSCAVGPDFVRPESPKVDSYVRTPIADQSANAQQLNAGAEIPAQWWRLFQSDQLNSLVDEAVAHNATLEAAIATLHESEDNLQAGYGVFFPQVDLGLAGSRARSAPIEQGLKTPSGIYNVVTLSGTVGYTLDVFGGERRAVEGLAAEADYQRYASKAAYVTLTANVVNASIARAAYAAQIRATGQMLALQQQQLDATRAQIKSGTSAYAAELSIATLIASTQATLAPLQQQLSQAENLLATLLDQLPAQSNLPALELEQLHVPLAVPVSVPSELVHQRPDILQAEAQLHIASANIGVATAAMYPSISLTGVVGQAGTSLGNLGGASGRFWSIGPSLSIPLFKGGTLWYERQAAIDAHQAAAANYRQTVLTGFAQVSTALQALEHDAQALQAQSEAQRYAQESLKLNQASYQSGVASYLDVMTADVQWYQASIAVIQAEAQRCQDTVALFVALGGGWWNASAGEPDQENRP
jgi:NodT family efflux transporter outer membrane factor (OMF) lipoprotein